MVLFIFQIVYDFAKFINSHLALSAVKGLRYVKNVLCGRA